MQTIRNAPPVRVSVVNLLVNIDVDDLEKATRFYCDGLGLRVGRRFDGWIELLGAAAPIYLLPKAAGTPISPVREAEARLPPPLDAGAPRLRRATTSAAAVKRAQAAGATLERDVDARTPTASSR